MIDFMKPDNCFAQMSLFYLGICSISHENKNNNNN